MNYKISYDPLEDDPKSHELQQAIEICHEMALRGKKSDIGEIEKHVKRFPDVLS